jgi:transcriptional regulator with XRE-family HTH domain
MEIEKQKLAKVVQDRRAAQALTQTELAEKTGISLRSVQRIEKGEVLPRPFTIRALATALSFKEEDLTANNVEAKPPADPGSRAGKIILSVIVPVVFLLLILAFLAQSATFPETCFEAALFWAAVIFVIGIFLWFLWTGKNKR